MQTPNAKQAPVPRGSFSIPLNLNRRDTSEQKSENLNQIHPSSLLSLRNTTVETSKSFRHHGNVRESNSRKFSQQNAIVQTNLSRFSKSWGNQDANQGSSRITNSAAIYLQESSELVPELTHLVLDTHSEKHECDRLRRQLFYALNKTCEELKKSRSHIQENGHCVEKIRLCVEDLYEEITKTHYINFRETSFIFKNLNEFPKDPTCQKLCNYIAKYLLENSETLTQLNSSNLSDGEISFPFKQFAKIVFGLSRLSREEDKDKNYLLAFNFLINNFDFEVINKLKFIVRENLNLREIKDFDTKQRLGIEADAIELHDFNKVLLAIVNFSSENRSDQSNINYADLCINLIPHLKSYVSAIESSPKLVNYKDVVRVLTYLVKYVDREEVKETCLRLMQCSVITAVKNNPELIDNNDVVQILKHLIQHADHEEVKKLCLQLIEHSMSWNLNKKSISDLMWVITDRKISNQKICWEVAKYWSDFL